MKTNNLLFHLCNMCFFLTCGTAMAQQTTLSYDSDTGAAGPQLELEESGDNGNGSGEDGWSRLWFTNSSDATNRWGFLARPHSGSMDNDGILTSPLVMAYTGIQKFGFGSDGTLRINKQYTLPNTDGSNGDILTTDGSGNVIWAPDNTGPASLWTESGADVYRASGKVGIGTTSPSAELEVKGAATSVSLDLKSSQSKQLNFKTNNSISSYLSDNGSRFVINKSAGFGNMEISSNNKIVVSAEGSPVMVMDDAKVTIGSNVIPSQMLDVPGKIEIADDATAATAGAMRYLNGIFEGYDGTDWLPLSRPKTVTQVITGKNFNPSRNGASMVNLDQYTYMFSTASLPYLDVCLPIPVDGKLLNVTMIARDESSTARLSMKLRKDKTQPGGGASQVSYSTVYTVDGANYDDYTIDLSNNNTNVLSTYEAFWVRIKPRDQNTTALTNWPDTDITFSKIVFEYELP